MPILMPSCPDCPVRCARRRTCWMAASWRGRRSATAWSISTSTPPATRSVPSTPPSPTGSGCGISSGSDSTTPTPRAPTPMASELQQTFRSYAELMTQSLRSAAQEFSPRAEGGSAVQVERGAVYAAALLDPRDAGRIGARVEPLLRLAGDPAALSTVAVVDETGHHRPAYRPLLVYGWLQAFKLLYEVLPRADFGRWDEALRAWCDLLEGGLGEARVADTGTPASRGGVVTEGAWTALALFAAGRLLVRDGWTDLASDPFGRLPRGQTPRGTFLTAGPSDNPEAAWYHELVLLHAAASYAVQAEDRPVAAAVARATEYHVRETQPDHATAQPWALFPFVWNPETRTLADQVLHAMTVNRPGAGPGGVALILLADAVY